MLAITGQAQELVVRGTVTDAFDGSPIPGVSVVLKGTTTGTITDKDGNYTLRVQMGDSLVFSFIGMETVDIKVVSAVTNVAMKSSTIGLDEVVVVGYGVQKKESVVGSIVQTSGDELQQSGGVSTVGQALTGRLPGVTTVSNSGRPGDESPQIFIRGKSTWNGSGQPLILVDGIERSMNDIDMNDIESLSVLKDASATAVFGVKGANGVILITTKRGKEGKAQLSLSASSSFKTPSKLPQKLDSYDALGVVNDAIERTVSYKDEAWASYTPTEELNKYRNYPTQYMRERYPDIDWADYMMKDFAMDHKINMSVRGGTKTVKYFGSLAYQHVGDIFKGDSFDNGRDYKSNFSYDRFNYRSNIDFDVTKSTRLSVNLSGYYGIQHGNDADQRLLYTSIYTLAPSLFYPIYSDGSYGRLVSNPWQLQNPALLMSAKGSTQQQRIQVNSDFVLDQKLDFITKGLSFKASLSYDNNFSGSMGIKETNPGGIDNVVYKLYNRDGSTYYTSPQGVNQFDYVIAPWYRDALSLNDWATSRRLFYQLSLNYSQRFADVHNVGVLALMNREEYAIGDMFPRYREDWVARVTYNYNSRYFLDVNGAYNGSEKFGPGYKFKLFPSLALGWMISNESFLDSFDSWLTKLKIRGSYGLVGDDSVGERWAYISQWDSGGRVFMNNADVYPANDNHSPYITYSEDVIGNPNLRWETAKKADLGLELSLLDNMFSLDVDYFKEDRYDIIVSGSDRSVPGFFGFTPSDANLGKTRVQGFELALGFRYQINADWDVWSNIAYTQAKDEIIYKEDPALRDAYRKDEGYSIGLPKVIPRDELMTSWDDVYASIPQDVAQEGRRPGYYDEIDFNSDGVINGDDAAPYGFPTRPENTYNFSLGFNYKNFSFLAQFYGAYNTSIYYNDTPFTNDTPLFFEFKTDYWTTDNQSGQEVLPSWNGDGDTDSYRDWYDGSYLKLKNVELGYTLNTDKNNMYRFYISGNDLYTWSHMPDDRQGESGQWGFYPNFRRITLGVNINF